MSSFSEKITALLQGSQEKSLFTHYSFSCGFLDPFKESFHSAGLPGSRSCFDLASLTKAFVTTPLVLQEFQGQASLEKATLASWLGPLEASPFTKDLQSLRVVDLLKHTSGLPRWWNFWVFCVGEGELIGKRERLIERLNEASKRIKPDQGFLYSDVGFLLLGLCLEIKHKKPLKDLFFDYLRICLGLADKSLFFPSCSLGSSEGFVPTAFCPLRGRALLGEVHDENCAFLGGQTGHAGLFGKKEGVLSFLEAFWKAKESNLFKLKVSPFSLKEPAFGFSSRFFEGRRAFGHLGFTGCGVWLFPDDSSYLLLLSNRVSSGRLSSSFGSLREELFLLGRKLLDSEKQSQKE